MPAGMHKKKPERYKGILDPDSVEQYQRTRWIARNSAPTIMLRLCTFAIGRTEESKKLKPSERIKCMQTVLQFAYGQIESEDIEAKVKPKAEEAEAAQLPVDVQIKYLEKALAALKSKKPDG